jgi:Methyltransferase domain
MLRHLADSDQATSFANRLRAKRFSRFEALAAGLPRPLRILDVGGTNVFWENRGWHERADVEILTLNLVAEKQQHANIRPLVGDATNLAQFGDCSIDIVFSNSLIEHLFTFENQRRMASEVQRVGKAYWIQTPNYWFPVEPHFHFVGWQWLPVAARTSILQRRACGWRGPCPDPSGARRLVEEIRLLTRSELQTLFPHAKIIAERFGGFVKSWTAVAGFN